MKFAWRKYQQSKTQQTGPTTLNDKLYPKEKPPTHIKHKGAIKTLETIDNTQSQRHLPKQARNNQQNQSATRKRQEQIYIPCVKMEEKVENCNAVTVKTRKSPAENPRASLGNKGA